MRSSISTLPSYFFATSRPTSRNTPVSAFRMLALCTTVTFLRPLLERVVERELDDLARSRAGVDAGRNRDRVRIVADRDVVLEGDIKAFEILSHQHDVDIVVSSARGPCVRTGRTLA